MACSSPYMVLFYKGDYQSAGWVHPFRFCRNPEEFLDVYSDPCIKHMLLPCGNCDWCKQNKQNEWTFRIIAESMYHNDNCFLTLTYDNAHLPCNMYGLPTLVKRDVQLFMKRLRKAYPENYIKYYACGEYGSKGNRPHYHLIIFGWKPTDLKVLEKWTFKKPYLTYVSDSLKELWPNGYHVVGDFTPDTAHYVSKYVSKPSSFYDSSRIQKPFRLVSTVPALGTAFFMDYYRSIFAVGKCKLGSKDYPIPAYFKKRCKELDPILYEYWSKRNEESRKAISSMKELGEVFERVSGQSDFVVATNRCKKRRYEDDPRAQDLDDFVHMDLMD